MAQPDNATQFQDVLLAPGSSLLEKAIGWVSLFVAAAFVAFDVFILMAMLRGKGQLWGLLALLALFAVLACFFAMVGYRLVRARPNAVGSILSPAVWFACVGVFGVLALLFIAGAIAKRDFAFAQGAAAAALLALLSFGAASHFRGQQRHGRP